MFFNVFSLHFLLFFFLFSLFFLRPPNQQGDGRSLTSSTSLTSSFFFFFFLSGAQNLFFSGPQFRYDFSLHFLSKKKNWWARVGRYPFWPSFLFFPPFFYCFCVLSFFLLCRPSRESLILAEWAGTKFRKSEKNK